MHFYRLLWAALALTCLDSRLGGAAMVPPSVLPGLGAGAARVVVDARLLPWRGVVRVQTEVGERCSGALIGPRLVLTAAHCLFGRGTGRLLQPGSIHVLTGLDHGDYAAHARATAVTIGTDFALGPDGQPLASSPPDADWALLTLGAALGTADRVLPVSRRIPALGTRLMLGGFEQDRAQVLVADVDCAIAGVVRAGTVTMLRHSCAGTRGVSGAPLLAQSADRGWAVIGVASSAGVGVSGGAAVPAAVIPVP